MLPCSPTACTAAPVVQGCNAVFSLGAVAGRWAAGIKAATAWVQLWGGSGCGALGPELAKLLTALKVRRDGRMH